MPKQSAVALPVELRILALRRQKVILDTALAKLSGVPVKRLNEQVKRNQERFPSDFMFRLTTKEHDLLRSQIATSKDLQLQIKKTGCGCSRFLAFVCSGYCTVRVVVAV
jgi:ORF6N domain